MSKDLNDILDGWDFDQSGIAARWIQGNEGHPKIQLRVNLGVLQMEVKGRPDGRQPEGHRTLLDFYKEKEDEGIESELFLGPAECSELQQEALQFYYRYLAFYALEYLDGVIDDTHHNLDLLSFVSQYAKDDDLAWQFLQFFPYVRMMNARARAEKMIDQKQYDAASRIATEALNDIRKFAYNYGDQIVQESGQEIEILEELLQRIRDKKPRSREEQLQEDLCIAIQTENYEDAASLRDTLRSLDVGLLPMQQKKGKA